MNLVMALAIGGLFLITAITFLIALVEEIYTDWRLERDAAERLWFTEERTAVSAVTRRPYDQEREGAA